MKRLFILSVFVLVAPIMLLAQSAGVNNSVENKEKKKVLKPKTEVQKTKKIVKGNNIKNKSVPQTEQNVSAKGTLVNVLTQDPIKENKAKKPE